MPRNGRNKRWLDIMLSSQIEHSECVYFPYGGAHGYGSTMIAGKNITASRYVLRSIAGPPPKHKPLALHTCGNGHRGCVNPSHLYWGDHRDNERDKNSQGKGNLGEQNPAAKLTSEQVSEIRRIYSQPNRPSQRAIGERFGVRQDTISKIVNGHLWPTMGA